MENKQVIVAEMKHAYKSFDHQAVLQDVALEVAAGTILGLIGPSGAGKTTAIKCLLGMEKLDQGTTEIFGKLMPDRKILQRIGYMGQSDALYENLSARENLTFFGKLMGMKGAVLDAAIEKNMALVKLTADIDRLVRTFSGGMKRRLSLAITLLSDPDLIILDEPTVGIDPLLRVEIWNQLRTLAKAGKALIVTTHVMDEAEKCDEIALIIDGQIFARGTPSDLKKQFHAKTIEEVFLKAEVSAK